MRLVYPEQIEQLHAGRVRAYATDPRFDDCTIPKDDIAAAIPGER